MPELELPPAPPPRIEASAPSRSGTGAHRRRGRVVPALLALALTVSAVETVYLVSGASGTGDDTGAETAGSVLRSGAAVQDLTTVVGNVMNSVVAVEVTVQQMTPFGVTEAQGLGSGVIVRSDLIVTNAHVVEGATQVTVVFDDGVQASGTVLGIDTARDLAVVSAETGDRPAVEIGSSADLELGSSVIALGYPLGLGATVTTGIVSGLDRTIDVARGDGTVEHLEGLLQTDAAINPGNSGGPLVDTEGRLVGINTAGSSAAENVGFAIAIDGAMPIIEDLAGAAA
jgi:S1-C subfamily serine protease